jgi:anti-sigma factor RsiW
MNECQNLQQQLDDYLSDRLSDFAHKRIDGHLRQCAECSEEVKEYREVIGELRNVYDDIKIEPSLSLQCKLEQMTNSNRQPVSAIDAVMAPAINIVQRNNRINLSLIGAIIFLIAGCLAVLNRFGVTEVSFYISASTALIGMTVLLFGLAQFMRRERN